MFSSELRVPDQDEDLESGDASSVASLVGSRNSSQWSLVRGGAAELDEDVVVST